MSMMHIWKTIRASKYFSYTLLDILDLSENKIDAWGILDEKKLAHLP